MRLLPTLLLACLLPQLAHAKDAVRPVIPWDPTYTQKLFQQIDAQMRADEAKKMQGAEAENAGFKLQIQLTKKTLKLSEANAQHFLRELAEIVAKSEGNPETAHDAKVARFMIFFSQRTYEEEINAISPLLVSEDPKQVAAARSLLAQKGWTCPEHGKPYYRFFFYRAPLQSAPEKIRTELVEHIFRQSPLEAAAWFAENTPLPPGEKERLLAEVKQAQALEDAAVAPPATAAKPKPQAGKIPAHPVAGVSPAPAAAVAAQSKILKKWLADPSWILGMAAKNKLEKNPAWLNLEMTIALKNAKNLHAPSPLTVLPEKPPSAP